MQHAFGPNLEEISSAVDWTLASAPDWADPALLGLGLTEALTNALVHGSLGVTSAGRSTDVSLYLSEVARRSEIPTSTRRTVHVNVERSAEKFTVTLHWRGTPCPPEHRNSGAQDPLAGSGLGQGIIQSAFDEVAYSEDGLSQTLTSLRPQSNHS